MNILIFSWRDIKNPDSGGAEVYTHEIAKRLVKRGYKITLFTSAFGGCEKEEFIDEIKVVRSGNKFSVYFQAYIYYKKYFKNKFDLIIDEINLLPWFTPLYVKEKKVMLIHQTNRDFSPNPNLSVSPWFCEHSFPVSYLGYYLIEPSFMRLYRKVPTITVSNSTKKELMALGFNKIFIVPEGLNIKPLDKLNKKEETPTLIFVGRLKKYKRPDHAIEAFKIVKREIPDAKLWVVGDGDMENELKKIACDGIKFFGWVSEKKKLELMKRAHAIIVPGVREGWGLVVTEANAVGTPAVGYNIPGLRDSIKHNKTGLLVNNNINDLAENIIYILNNNELIKKLSKNALEDSRKYNWDRSAEEFLKVMESIKNEE